jgi:hypothetical protein
MCRSEEASLVLDKHQGMLCYSGWRPVHLSQGFDVFHWSRTENGNFTVASMYNTLVQPDISVDNNKKIGKMKIPLKTKVFVWYLRRWVILTKYNPTKRNWHESKYRVFCQHDETIKHLFFESKFSRSI